MKEGKTENGEKIKIQHHSEKISLMREAIIKKANLKLDSIKTDKDQMILEMNKERFIEVMNRVKTQK
jgi:hypothetical protein